MALLESAIEALKHGNPATRAWVTGYERWKQCFATSMPGTQRWSVIVRADSRILLHVSAGSSVTDGGVLLHHTWGVPYLPGSALKGVARSALREGSLRRRVELVDPAVLGDLLGQGPADRSISQESNERAAFIDFLDAPWVPHEQAPCDWSPLMLDVVTPHHGRYYTESQGRPLPSDFDEPVPTHRLSISPDTKFHIVIEAHELVPPQWLELVMAEVLLPALEHDGIGAWTTSGYGRLKELEKATRV